MPKDSLKPSLPFPSRRHSRDEMRLALKLVVVVLLVSSNMAMSVLAEEVTAKRVLIVDGAPETKATALLEIAIEGWFEIAALRIGHSYEVMRLDHPSFPKRLLDRFDTLLLCNLREFPAKEVPELEAFMRRGGNVVILLGDRVDAESYNRILFRGGKGVLPAKLGVILDRPNRIASLGAQDLSEEILEKVNVQRSYSLSEFNKKGIIASLTSGPFLVEKNFGQGKCILCSTAFDRKWNDLPTSVASIPFLIEMLNRAGVHPDSASSPLEAKSRAIRVSVDPAYDVVSARSTIKLSVRFIGFPEVPDIVDLEYRINGKATRRQEIKLEGTQGTRGASFDLRPLGVVPGISLQAIIAEAGCRSNPVEVSVASRSKVFANLKRQCFSEVIELRSITDHMKQIDQFAASSTDLEPEEAFVKFLSALRVKLKKVEARLESFSRTNGIRSQLIRSNRESPEHWRTAASSLGREISNLHRKHRELIDRVILIEVATQRLQAISEWREDLQEILVQAGQTMEKYQALREFESALRDLRELLKERDDLIKKEGRTKKH